MHYRALIFPIFLHLLRIEAIASQSTMPSLTHPEPLGPPLPTGQYSDLAKIKALLQAHARGNKYAIASNCSTLKKAAWVCLKNGKYNDKCKA
jgi:hypothetical protein